MPTYQVRISRESKETQKRYPNLTAPVYYGLTKFSHPRDLRGVSSREVKDVVQAQLQQTPPDEIEFDKPLRPIETVDVYMFKADKNPVIEVGEIEIPEKHQGEREVPV